MPLRRGNRECSGPHDLFCSSLGTALALVAVPVYSQQQSPMADMDSPLLNEILVTRSRRPRIGPGSEQNLVNIGPFNIWLNDAAASPDGNLKPAVNCGSGNI
jgi:hypothetical protein